MRDLRVEMKELGAGQWTDITSRTVRSAMKIRRGFSSLGRGADLGKLSITYKASDLAIASVFHTTAKQVRISDKNTDDILFEGYTEGSASVQTSKRSSDAWVSVSAYPYLHALESATLKDEVVEYDLKVSDPTFPAKSVLHLIWSRMLDSIDPLLAGLVRSVYSIDFPIIPASRPVLILNAGGRLWSEFSKVCGEFTLCPWVDGFTVRFSAPYADDTRDIRDIAFTSVRENPTIKTAPYITAKRPIVTTTRIDSKDNVTVYALDDDETDGEWAGQELLIGDSYPEEGKAVLSYTTDDQSETYSLYCARNPHLSMVAKRSDNGADAVLTKETWKAGGNEAEVRLINDIEGIKVNLNQLKVVADRAYFLDTSTVVEADVEGDDVAITASYLSTSEQAKNYIDAYVAERKAETSTMSFTTNLLDINPNDLVAIGNIPAVYLVRTVERDLIEDMVSCSCVMFDLADVSVDLLTYKGGRKGSAKPKDNYQIAVDNGFQGTQQEWLDSMRNTFEFAWSSSATEIDDDVTVYMWDGLHILINGVPIGDMDMDMWSQLVSVAPAGKPYLWVRINGGAEFRLTGQAGKVFRIKSINPSQIIKNLNMAGYQTVTLEADIQNYDAPNPVWLVEGNAYAGERVQVSLPYSIVQDVRVLLYNGDDLIEEAVVSVTDVTDIPIYDGATDNPTSFGIPSDGRTHARLWVGETGTYDVAGASVTLTKNVPYRWTGVVWESYRDINVSNASIMLAMLKDADGSYISDDGVYAWFKNLIAQTAVINQLFSNAITLLDGGSIQSENYTEGESGFRISSDGVTEFRNCIIAGSRPQIICPTFESRMNPDSATITYEATITSNSASNQISAIKSSPLWRLPLNAVIPCTCSTDPSVRYVKRLDDDYSGVFFYDKNLQRIGWIVREWNSSFTHYIDWSDYTAGTHTFIASMGTTDFFIFKNIPNSLSLCTTVGQVYSDAGTLKIKL